MKTIVVPVDFSEFSLKGLDLALLFAKKMKANIEMVYVQKKTGEYYPSIKEQQLKWAEDKFKEIQRHYCHNIAKRCRLDYIIKHGKVSEEIVNQAQSHKDAFIITSTHGVSGFDEIFLGSNATKIIALSEKPVITINSGAVPTSIETIILPIDHTKDTRQKVPYTIELAKLFKAEIFVVAVSLSKNDEFMQKALQYVGQVCKLLDKENIVYQTKELSGKSIPDIIIKYGEQVNADLISIMSEQTSISSFLLGSQAELLLSKSSIPVLTITPKELFMHDSFRTQGHSA